MISTVDRATILLVEADLDARRVLTALLGELGYGVVAANSAERALDALNVVAPDLILTDVHLGAISGIELCARVKSDPRYELTPLVILTALSERESRLAGLVAGADDFVAKPVELAELRARVTTLLRVKSLVDPLERTEAVVTSSALTIEARDTYTSGHSDRLAHYAVAVGRALGVDAPTLRALRLGAYLHDLGRIAVPESTLLKPGLLDAQERKLMQAHSIVGSDLVQGLRGLDLVRPIIRHHHERLDGSGYPDGLKGEAIPLGARIISCVDVYDALHCPRPYRSALPHDEAISVLLQETDSGYWDPPIVRVFIDVLRDFKHDPVSSPLWDWPGWCLTPRQQPAG
jgi:putative two-component system response regulator